MFNRAIKTDTVKTISNS